MKYAVLVILLLMCTGGCDFPAQWPAATDRQASRAGFRNMQSESTPDFAKSAETSANTISTAFIERVPTDDALLLADINPVFNVVYYCSRLKAVERARVLIMPRMQPDSLGLPLQAAESQPCLITR